ITFVDPSGLQQQEYECVPCKPGRKRTEGLISSFDAEIDKSQSGTPYKDLMTAARKKWEKPDTPVPFPNIGDINPHIMFKDEDMLSVGLKTGRNTKFTQFGKVFPAGSILVGAYFFFVEWDICPPKDPKLGQNCWLQLTEKGKVVHDPPYWSTII